MARHNPEDRGSRWPDDNYKSPMRRQVIDKTKTVFATFQDDTKMYSNENTTSTKKDPQWFFVNGIMTNVRIAQNNATALNVVFDKLITVLHNPTRGIFMDIYECLMGRTFNRTVNITLKMFNHIKPILEQGNKVVLLGHSQGGIIVSNIVRLIIESGLPLSDGQLEVYTLAGAQDEFSTIEGMCCEHFANEKDYVARIGVLNYKDRIEGDHYVRDGATGHLLNAHYLEALTRGAYCGGNSKLYAHVKQV
jgi:hypothetical protein